MSHKLFICETCLDAQGQTPGPDMADAVRAALQVDIEVMLTPCMNLCEEPVSLAFRAPGKMAYLFSGTNPKDVNDITAMARLFVEAEGGVIDDARPAGRLRFCLKGRIPAE
ncbi:Predicted metal-binding protein [Shimia gijangensis]|uniref:Predicted metal-binding protein n=1 Tax=Shimia gijangensis TaxID=1470563 RepID=A0A1M6BGY5_9RHOB|nr:DUF1636 family protein [Shimia gijangensis]SHI47733.1 Predicted metal-binding protein [Shimia gijangensis]